MPNKLVQKAKRILVALLSALAFTIIVGLEWWQI